MTFLTSPYPQPPSQGHRSVLGVSVLNVFEPSLCGAATFYLFHFWCRNFWQYFTESLLKHLCLSVHRHASSQIPKIFCIKDLQCSRHLPSSQLKRTRKAQAACVIRFIGCLRTTNTPRFHKTAKHTHTHTLIHTQNHTQTHTHTHTHRLPNRKAWSRMCELLMLTACT